MIMSDAPIKVLLIEDNPGDARLLSEMLVDIHAVLFELEWVDRLAKGLERLASESFDVTLVDLNLPDGTGLETFRKVHDCAPQVPIIILSGLLDEEMAVRTVREGAQDYILKGNIDGQLLERAIHYAIERKRSEKALKRVQEALRESQRKIEGLLNIAKDLAACQSEEETYRITVKAAEKILSFPLCSLSTVEGNSLIVRASSSGMPQNAGAESDLREPSVAAETIRTGKTIRFRNLTEVPQVRPDHSEFKSGISAPIGACGVLQVMSTQENNFNEEDQKLLELLVGHTIEALQRIRLQSELQDQAIRDPLTGVFNRRYFSEVINKEKERSRRYGRAIGFLLIDVDRFKQINDTHGHQTGDQVLKEVAAFLKNQIRASEMVVRYGGDEFLIVLPELAGGIDVVKNRIVEAMVQWNQLERASDLPVYLSIGGAVWDASGKQTLEEVLAQADRAMYEDKRSRDAQAVRAYVD